MAYTNSDIENKALSLIGSELPAESAGILKAVCASAAAELESRLRKGVSSEEIQELFVTAAGMLRCPCILSSAAFPETGWAPSAPETCRCGLTAAQYPHLRPS